MEEFIMCREYGYVRVSDKDQNEDRQLKAMHDIGIKGDFIFTDKASGKNFNRPEYIMLKRVLREGDILFVKSLDRFGRNKQEILNEWKWLIDNKVDIVIIDMPILDTRKYKGLESIGQLITDLVLQILSWLAEEERTIIKKRQQEGIVSAKSKGKHLGRPQANLSTLSKEQRSILESVYPAWDKGDVTAVEFMNQLNLKKNTFYKIVKEYMQARQAAA
jgi:DNA invertase Pin-like site-specific DNA recombinase